jgi:hypothetical protein
MAMVGNWTVGSQTRLSSCRVVIFILAEWACHSGPFSPGRVSFMVNSRIKPHFQQVAERERRAEQRRLYRRNQVFGLLIVAAAIVAWWLFHTNPKWIFPPGWWRP